MEQQNEAPDNRELYALFNLSPEASYEEIRKAYRQWAQVYHPDKCQSPHMKETATDSFQRVREAYEILSDPKTRLIYDIYGMEGLTSDLESGLEFRPRLDEAAVETKKTKPALEAELERLMRLMEREKNILREREKIAGHIRSSDTVLANMSLPHYLDGDGLFRGMAMTTEIQAQLSKRNAFTIGVDGHEGAVSAVFGHQISEVSSVEFMASAGLRALNLIGVQTSRKLSSHSAATVGLAMSLKDGSWNLSNLWTRQLSETAGRTYFGMTIIRSCRVAKKDESRSASGDVKFGTGSFETSVHYTHRFSSKSLGCIAGKVGSSSLEIEVGGERKLSKYSGVRWLYIIGIQGISWKFELYCGGQKLIIPIFLTRHLNPVFATGALVVPASLYFVLKSMWISRIKFIEHKENTSGNFSLMNSITSAVPLVTKKFVIKPYYLKRNKQKALEKEEKTCSQVQEARAAAEKDKKLQKNVANWKRTRQLETGGLVILRALYGNQIILNNLYSSSETSFESTSGVTDVTITLNFLVNDSGQLKVHEGIKKSRIMGFYDTCPGEPKQLYVEYAYAGNQHKVLVGDYEELLIPQGTHRNHEIL